MENITNKCTGCGACSFVCPKNAIKKILHDNGTITYAIDENRCIHCNKCKKICHTLRKDIKSNTIKYYYVAWSNQVEVLSRSSSGGVFYELAQYIIRNGGVVFGAVYANHFKEVRHIPAISLNGIREMCGSKYVDSEMSDVFQNIKIALGNNQLVLFSGTPCQCASVRSVFGQNDNLYLVELICNGVQYPLILKKYIEFWEKSNSSVVKEFSMRYKKGNHYPLYLYVGLDNEKVFIDPFYKTTLGKAYGTRISLKDCCYHCAYKGKLRVADITIGDHHRKKSEFIDNYPKMGSSSVFVNSIKGEYLINNIKGLQLTLNNFPLSTGVYTHNSRLMIQGYAPSKKNRYRFLKRLSDCDSENINLIVDFVSKYETKPYIFFRKITDRIEILKRILICSVFIYGQGLYSCW